MSDHLASQSIFLNVGDCLLRTLFKFLLGYIVKLSTFRISVLSAVTPTYDSDWTQTLKTFGPTEQLLRAARRCWGHECGATFLNWK
jgi:hypothetical protein